MNKGVSLGPRASYCVLVTSIDKPFGTKHQYDLFAFYKRIHPIQTKHTTPYSKQLHHKQY